MSGAVRIKRSNATSCAPYHLHLLIYIGMGDLMR